MWDLFLVSFILKSIKISQNPGIKVFRDLFFGLRDLFLGNFLLNPVENLKITGEYQPTGGIKRGKRRLEHRKRLSEAKIFLCGRMREHERTDEKTRDCEERTVECSREKSERSEHFPEGCHWATTQQKRGGSEATGR